MKKTIVSAALAFAAMAAMATTPDGWTDDFDAAKARAKAEGKLMLVDFSGSDWCGWCQRLDEEVFAKQEFIEAATNDFVLVLIDSPEDKSKLSEKAKNQNPRLMKEYGIKGVPSVLVMDAEGNRLFRTGYRSGGPKPYLEKLAEIKKAVDSGEDLAKKERDKDEAEKKAAEEKRAAVEAVMEKYWTEDFDTAKERAAKAGKSLFVYFCDYDTFVEWTLELEAEVLSNAEFLEAAQKDYILVRIVLPPRYDNNPSEKKKRNLEIAEKYGAKFFMPVVVIMDSNGKKLARETSAAYQGEGPVNYLKKISGKGDDGLEPGESTSDDSDEQEATGMPECWTDDFDAAKAQAKAEGKLMLVDFSGSDWCGWCQRLDKEVFSKKEFTEAATNDFVLVMIDSPKDESKLSEKAKKQNPKLVEKYEISGFPSVLIMDADGNRLCKTGYRRGGPEKYLEHLADKKTLIAEIREFRNSIAALESGCIERIARIAGFLEKLDQDVMEEHEDLVNELLANDKDGKFAVKYPYFAYYMPAKHRFDEFSRQLEDEFRKRINAFGCDNWSDLEKIAKEDIAKVQREIAVIALDKLPMVKKAIEDFKASAPKSIQEEIDDDILDFLNSVEKGMREVANPTAPQEQ